MTTDCDRHWDTCIETATTFVDIDATKPEDDTSGQIAVKITTDTHQLIASIGWSLDNTYAIVRTYVDGEVVDSPQTFDVGLGQVMITH